MAINNAPLEGTKYSPYELNLGYHPCLAPDTFWETRPNIGQSTTAKAWMKRMHKDWQRARSALVVIKTSTTARANRHRQQSLFKVGDLVMLRMFPVIRTQLNKGGAFADRWASPYRVSEQVSLDSFRLELTIAESSRMGRVFNAIELKPYHC